MTQKMQSRHSAHLRSTSARVGQVKSAGINQVSAEERVVHSHDILETTTGCGWKERDRGSKSSGGHGRQLSDLVVRTLLRLHRSGTHRSILRGRRSMGHSIRAW